MPHRLEVFDPAMCCSSGVCGPRIDPVLLRITSDLQWLRQQGVTVARYNLAQQPQAFVDHPVVATELAAAPDTCLPLILVDGTVISRGTYPTRAQLAEWLHLSPQIKPAASDS